jgi:hypothetical protein
VIVFPVVNVTAPRTPTMDPEVAVVVDGVSVISLRIIRVVLGVALVMVERNVDAPSPVIGPTVAISRLAPTTSAWLAWTAPAMTPSMNATWGAAAILT